MRRFNEWRFEILKTAEDSGWSVSELKKHLPQTDRETDSLAPVISAVKRAMKDGATPKQIEAAVRKAVRQKTPEEPSE